MMQRAACRRWVHRWRGLVLLAGLLGIAGLLFARYGGPGQQKMPSPASVVNRSGGRPQAVSSQSVAANPLIIAARETAEMLVERFADDPRAWDMLARLHHLCGENSAAITLWEECLRREPQYLDAQIAIGMLRFESGQFIEAEQILLPAFLQAPSHGQAAYLLASSLLNQGKLEDTVEVLRGHLSIDAQSVPSLVLLGQALLQQKQPAEAKQHFLAATRLAPDYTNAWFGLATASQQLGQPAEATGYLKQFRALQTQQLQHDIQQTQGYDDLQNTREAVAETYLTAGRLYLEHGDESEAERQWRAALTLDAGNLPARMDLAQLFQRQNRPRETLEVLLPLRDVRRDDPRLWIELGYLHAQLDEFENADQSFERAIELAPESATGYAARAELRVRAERDPAQAVQFARQAVERQASGAHYRLLSEAAEQSGDRPLALDAIQRALQLEPSNPSYQRRYAWLRTSS